MEKKYVIFAGIVSFVLILVSFTSAFAVSSRNFNSFPVELSPGETQEISISLQNMAGTEDITVEGSVTQGAEIAKLLGDSNIYSVPLGQRTYINVSFSAPEEATISQVYSVVLFFRIVEDSGSKAVGIGSGVEKEIPVLIVPAPKKEIKPFYIYLLVGLILVVLLLIAYKLFPKKSKKKR